MKDSDLIRQLTERLSGELSRVPVEERRLQMDRLRERFAQSGVRIDPVEESMISEYAEGRGSIESIAELIAKRLP